MSGFIPIDAISSRSSGPSDSQILKLITSLDGADVLDAIDPVLPIKGWRVRKEDFGVLAFHPRDRKLVRIDAPEEIRRFFAESNVVQFVEGRSVPFSLRAPVKLFLDITKICNLKCEHCLSNSGVSTETLPGMTILDLLDQAHELGIFQVKLGGGEPVLHPRFASIVCRANSLGIAVSLSTNAITMTSQRIQFIASCGVKISVSLDGDENLHDKVRGTGAYKGTMAGLRRLIDAGVSPTLRMTLFNHPSMNNLSSVRHIIELGQSLGLGVKLRRAKPAGRAVENDISLAFPTPDYWEVLGWLEEVREQGAEVDIEDLMCLSGDGSEKLFPTTFDCAAGTRSIHVNVYGNISPCVFLDASHISGNIFRQSLSEIWYEGNGFRAARAYTTTPNSDCRGCERNRLCSGECRALVMQAQRILGETEDASGKDPCCPKERRSYNYEVDVNGKCLPVRRR